MVPLATSYSHHYHQKSYVSRRKHSKAGLISTVLALLAGGMLAWCVVRSDIPENWLQPI